MERLNREIRPRTRVGRVRFLMGIPLCYWNFFAHNS